MDAYYGAESGNEIFFVLPVAHVLADHGISKANLHSDNVDFANDVWVYTKDIQGVDVDSSIAFIPNSVRVDPKTGSTYEPSIDQDGQYQKVDDTSESCTAREYWESFFIENPNLRPKRVVFYDGEPNDFLAEWKRENTLTPDVLNVSRQLDEERADNDYKRYRELVVGEINRIYPPSEEVKRTIKEIHQNLPGVSLDIAKFMSDGAYREFFSLPYISGDITDSHRLFIFAYRLMEKHEIDSINVNEVYEKLSPNSKKLVDMLKDCVKVSPNEILDIYKYDYDVVTRTD